MRRYVLGGTNRRHVAVFVVVSLFAFGALVSFAIAQSNSAFNLNSPAAFPVDI